MFFNFLNVNANYNELAYSFKFNGINGKQISLDDYKGKVIVVVNVASRCGYTPQYSELQDLWTTYKDENVDFPLFQKNSGISGNHKDFSRNCSLRYPGKFGTGKSRETSLIQNTVSK